MSDKRKILIQLDTDSHASTFDRVVAVDAGVDQLFSYGNVKPEDVRGLVHGAIFTRGPDDLKRTAIFIGGSDVTAAEKLLAEVRKHMMPKANLRVSVLLDANGANTTAAAAVRAAARHVVFSTTRAIVLGGTGPVGQRVALLLAREGAEVRVASRQQNRAAAVCDAIRTKFPAARVEPCATTGEEDLHAAMAGRTLAIAAGAAGVVLLPRTVRLAAKDLKVAVDLNAVPPTGIEGVEAFDKGVQHEGVICYGAIGVGGTKMKIHKAAVARLFESNDQVMDAEEVYVLAQHI